MKETKTATQQNAFFDSSPKENIFQVAVVKLIVSKLSVVCNLSWSGSSCSALRKICWSDHASSFAPGCLEADVMGTGNKIHA